ncbi:DJ-1/PfpI family protein [Xanthomonas pisi]|nr:DJ-1/PfpI family protein [Xanthomonas pisi]
MDVSAVTLEAGPLSTFTDLGRPGFRIATETTVAQFDAMHPLGADYIIVPAQASTPRLLAWLKRQSRQGATIVTICNGALVAAQMGMLDGRHATAHWSTGAARTRQYPAIRWTPNRRYVADGNWISTAGVSAAIPHPSHWWRPSAGLRRRGTSPGASVPWRGRRSMTAMPFRRGWARRRCHCQKCRTPTDGCTAATRSTYWAGRESMRAPLH